MVGFSRINSWIFDERRFFSLYQKSGEHAGNTKIASVYEAQARQCVD
jgi:hypothetical protein